MTQFSAELANFINSVDWVSAKTYASTWPHSYIVRDKVDEEMFERLVRYIREHGFEASFYDQTYIYFQHGDHFYWTMGAPVEETTVINRCTEENSYEHRRRNGTLPEDLDKESN